MKLWLAFFYEKLFVYMFYFLVDLSTALTSDALSGVLSNPETLQQLQSHLPAVDGSTQEALRSTLASPQFQQVRKLVTVFLY